MFLCFLQYLFAKKSEGSNKLVNIGLMNKETCEYQCLRKMNF